MRTFTSQGEWKTVVVASAELLSLGRIRQRRHLPGRGLLLNYGYRL